MAKETFYFSHDYNARNDIKIKRLIATHGYAGYGIFWAIIEDLYNNKNCLPTDFKIIAYNLRANLKIVTSIIKDFELFVVEKENFGSVSIQKRLESRDAKSTKARESAHKRWGNDANALRTEPERNAIYDSIVEETIVKDTKEKKEKPKPSGEASSLFVSMKSFFLEWYRTEKGSEYYFSAKDGYAINQLIKKIEFSGAKKNIDKPPDVWKLDAFKWILNNLQERQNWVYNNLSMSNINSKFNEIKDGTITTNKSQSRESAIATGTRQVNADLARFIAAGNPYAREENKPPGNNTQ